MLAASMLVGSAVYEQPPAYAAVSAAPAEQATHHTTPAAGLQHLLPAAPALASIGPPQLVGPAAAAEELPQGQGPAAEDDDDNAALIFAGLVFAVVVFTSTRSGSGSGSSSSAIDQDALGRRDRFPWSGFSRFGDDFDWVDDD
jgi:hypothetical protein